MLSYLSIHNFAIVKSLQLDLSKGMTTITGETGAGKSIAIDALSLCLGARAESHFVRAGEEKADISASFDLQNNIKAKHWLEDNDLFDTKATPNSLKPSSVKSSAAKSNTSKETKPKIDISGNSEVTHLEDEECIVRRVITKEGRSRAYINGTPVPLSQLKQLGQHLLHIHGQHAHHQLIRQESQLELVDQYAGHHTLLNKVKKAYLNWRQAKNALQTLHENQQENTAKKQLLEYQLKELDELALDEDEFLHLEEEYKRLSNSGQIVDYCQQIIHQLSEDTDANVLSRLQSCNQDLQQLVELEQNLHSLPNMLNEAIILLDEIHSELHQYTNSLDIDPQKIAQTEQRFNQIMHMARKHHVMPEKLYQHHQDLCQQMANLTHFDENLEELEQEIETHYANFTQAALKLSKSRCRYAKELNQLITKSMNELSLEGAQFEIQVEPETKCASPLGFDQVSFLVSTNPGQPLQSLAKVASGGELSRISLAIQVITAQKIQTPTLIFDEVDVGISGPTANIVGKMLRQLGLSTQVLCVTHLPQVAACGHQQLFVAKKTQANQTQTQMYPLAHEERIQELARLLGGCEITDSTLANAKDLLIAA